MCTTLLLNVLLHLHSHVCQCRSICSATQCQLCQGTVSQLLLDYETSIDTADVAGASAIIVSLPLLVLPKIVELLC
jgi:hypothetical protein